MGVLLCRGLQPMLVDVGFQLVTGRTQVALPQVALLEAHLVEDAHRQSWLVVGKELGVAKPAVNRCDHTRLASEIPGRAAMTEHPACGHAHTVTSGEPCGGHRLGNARARSPHHGTPSLAALRPAFACLLRTCARRASIASRVSTFCSTSRLRTARIHFS